MNMRNFTINSRKVVSILSGLFFVGLILNTTTERIPLSVVKAETSRESSSIAVEANVENISDDSNPISFIVIPYEQVEHEEKVFRIRKYLQSRKSPLSHYAEDFVNASEEYHIDYRIVASISIIESGGGKKNFRPFNAWGWGNNGFSDWTEGIWTVSKGIGKYYSKGLTTPRLISYSYCPPSSDAWASKVQAVMNIIAQ